MSTKCKVGPTVKEVFQNGQGNSSLIHKEYRRGFSGHDGIVSLVRPVLNGQLNSVVWTFNPETERVTI